MEGKLGLTWAKQEEETWSKGLYNHYKDLYIMIFKTSIIVCNISVNSDVIIFMSYCKYLQIK